MWTYEQATGNLMLNDRRIAIGYSGLGAARNNPHYQDIANVGPIPRGRYLIGPPADTRTHGPYVLRLTACDPLGMHGRDGFLIHGDSQAHPGTTSHGCIVLPRSARERIGQSEVELLDVV